MVSNNKLLCYSSKYCIFSKGPKLLIKEGTDGKVCATCHFPDKRMRLALGSVRIIARALRLEPRCGIFIDETQALVSYHGAIYRVDCEKGTITEEHRFRPEMNNPLCFVQINGVKGFTDGVYYGEYYLNHDKKDVSIYRRNKDGIWAIAYTFPAGDVYHIHGIIPCHAKDCVYILTGDSDHESGVFQATDDFRQVTTIIRGRQAYRACVALPTEKGLLYTTDTPLEDNYLYHLDFGTKEIERVLLLSGPSIYFKRISDTEMVFSTTVESDSRLPRWRYEFSWRLGPGVKDRYCRIYHVKVDGESAQVNEIFRAKKDIIPGGCGQMGTMMFPDGEGPIYVTGQSIRKYDNKTFSIEI